METQDHKPKKKAPEPKGVHVTVRGVELVIPAAAVDDFELMEDLVAAQDAEESDDPKERAQAGVLAFRVLKRLLPDSELSKLKEALRDEVTGRVPQSEMMSALIEIFEAADPNS